MSKYISIQNEDVGIRSFEIMSDAAPTLDLGGFTVERTITAAGTAIAGRTRKLWQIESLSVYCDIENGDVEFLQEITNQKKESGIVYEHIDGYTYSGLGGVSGDIKYNAQTKTADLTFTGGGELRKV